MLHLRVFSFSFHKGLPFDESGNGGGFVFDCRCLPNPAREGKYRTKSGLDAEVVAYLDACEGVSGFYEASKVLIEQAVSNYQIRGFESLMVGFGCTGGQHRSVYFAERLARHFCGQNAVNVTVEHIAAPEWKRADEGLAA